MEWLWFILGLALLVAGAEILIKGGSRFAALLGLSPLAIGLTVVAYGTSMPELVVSVKASLDGQAGIAVGNVVGSNIFNILLILGLSALVLPLKVTSKLIRVDVPIMIGVSCLLLAMSLDAKIGIFEGIFLITGVVAYTFLAFKVSRHESKERIKEYEKEISLPKKDHKTRQLIGSLLFIVSGLLILVLGARFLLDNAVLIARSLGVSETVIGLTLVAAGTSLPELATSVIATIRGERDIAIGNVVGSNIYNILGILGLSSLFATNGLKVASSMIYFDIPFMTAVAVVCLLIFLTKREVSRWEGALFLSYYIAYTVYLYLDSIHSTHLILFNQMMIYFIIPVTILMISISIFNQKRRA